MTTEEKDLLYAFQDKVQSLLEQAGELGIVVTVTQEPLQPLAMRNYETLTHKKSRSRRDSFKQG